jgi:CheY-like chemotaxis protein
MKAILFVDDHEVLARLSCEILQMHGYLAEYAYSAEDALARFQGKRFDILITDYRMEGMNGLELARTVRQQAPEIPIIVVTGYPAAEGSGEVNAWIDKHDMFPALLDKIRLFIGESETQEVDSRQTLNPA